MIREKQGSGTAPAAFAIVVVLVVTVMGIVSFALPAAGGPATVSSTSPSGIQLKIELNATEVLPGSALTAEVILFNRLSQNVSVTPSMSANSTVSSWMQADGDSCGGIFSSMAAYTVFQGHYTPKNLSAGVVPLTLVPPFGDIGCIHTPPIIPVVLLPHGDMAAWSYEGGGEGPVTMDVATLVCVNPPSLQLHCPMRPGLFGHWDESYSGSDFRASSPGFHYLSAGEYTIVAEDQWGQSVFAYFQVIP